MKKRWYLISGAALLLICCALLFLLLQTEPEGPVIEREIQQAVEEADRKQPGPALEPELEILEEPPYVSPVDFAALREMNEDIYAWLYIPGTEISYPILQREGDDGYYLRRNSQGEADSNGVIFTESTYNGRDLTDPVTIVYGHHMRSGAMFGRLQETYSSLEGLTEYGEIVVYLPEEEIRYRVFAGVPFSNIHILYYYDFSKTHIFQAFLDHIQAVRGIDAHINEEIEVTPEDQLLILSTCLQGNNKRRYLILAKRMDDRTVIPSMTN